VKIRIPQYSDIVKAHERIKPYVHNTHVLTSSGINSIIGSELYFKCENFQKVGAFKFRGATNAILSLRKEDLVRGVATHSSGNHAAALALAARIQKIPAFIVMPENVPEVKKKAVKGYGANITFCEPTLEARESTLKKVILKTGASFIHPYDNYDVICGQGTATRELMEEVPDLEVVIAPVGGGGLLSGSAIVAKSLKPGIKVVAAEPQNADDAFRSFYERKLIPSVNPETIADGLLTSLSQLTFSIILEKVDDIYTATEDSIIRAMKLIWERMKIIIEPSSALPLAILLQHREKISGKRIGIIISGGNVELTKMAYFFSLNTREQLIG
jgi:threonine dehydratase